MGINLKARMKLANLPTPLQKVSYDNYDFYIKRDDFTGLEFSGNKIRKLEYLLYDAKRKGADTIFTCGAAQSNHARAAAVSAIPAGFETRLFLWGTDTRNAEGNLFIDKFLGADLTFLNKKEYMKVDEVMLAEKEKYEKRGKKVYIIPSGGSSEVGILGYINFIYELSEQRGAASLNGILNACGSCGTSAGLLVGTALYNWNIKIYAVPVIHNAEDAQHEILRLAQKVVDKYKLQVRLDENRLEVLGGYSKEGYKNITAKKVKRMKDFARGTGIIFDPAYTGKAFNAYYDTFIKPGDTKKIMFLHTGGFFGSFSKRKEYLSA